MAEISSVSQTELAERRRQLRQQRRWRIAQTGWQMIAISGITGMLIWAVSLPDWMIRSPRQVVIHGNQFLSPETIRSLLPVHYPQFLLSVKPQVIADRLESEAPIAEATVTRHLFPPGLTVYIQERYPVAVAYNSEVAPPGQTAQTNLTEVALLDEKGTWIPYESYVSLNLSRDLPRLKVIGMQDRYRRQWMSLYQQISRSPVQIYEIDWRDPTNLILETELGSVHLGSLGGQLSHQLLTLDQMRQLSTQISLDDIEYIDLRNPKAPMLQTLLPREGARSLQQEPEWGRNRRKSLELETELEPLEETQEVLEP